jgi:hypothetical protein
MEKIWICVYRDTVETHNDNWNLTEIQVAKHFAKQYFDECKAEYFDSFEEFLNEYTADNTEDFYSYALKHHEIISIAHW